MRTRSSKSYALVPSDIYEVAGYGLLETIEESFYLDDEESDADGKEKEDHGEVDRPGLIDRVDSEEKESIAVQQRPKQLIVRLRIPNTCALPISSPGHDRRGLASETERSNARPTSCDKLALNGDRPCLMVVLRIPRPAGQVKELLAEATTVQPIPPRVTSVISDVSIDIVPLVEDMHKELKEEISGVQGEASPNTNPRIPDQTCSQTELLPDQVTVDGRYVHVCAKEELGGVASGAVEHQDEQSLALELPGNDVHCDIGVPDHAQGSQDEQSKSNQRVAPKIEDNMSFESTLMSTMLIEPLVEEDTPLEELEVEGTVEAATGEMDVAARSELLHEIQTGGQVERLSTESSLRPSERGSSPGISSSSSSLFEDDMWPVMKTSDISTASLMPTPLTMPSPEFPPVQMAIPSREPLPQHQSRKRNHSDDSTSETATHGHKRLRLDNDLDKTNISMSELSKATRGTGVVEAGLTAQQRRRPLPKSSHVPTERAHISRGQQQQQQAKRPVQRPKRKPLEKSGRQKLLEQRISSSSQRRRGSGKSRAMVRPPKKGRNGS